MDDMIEDRIRARAYELWVQDGRIQGRSDEYWIQAERELLGRPEKGRLTKSQSESRTPAEHPDRNARASETIAVAEPPAAKGARRPRTPKPKRSPA
jgi:hypothetical protein